MEGSIKDQLTHFRHPGICLQKSHLKHLLFYGVKKWDLSNLSDLLIYQLLILDTDSRMRPLSLLSDRKANEITTDMWFRGDYSQVRWSLPLENRMEQFLTPCIWCHLPSYLSSIPNIVVREKANWFILALSISMTHW